MKKTKAKTGVELLLPEYAQEVDAYIKDGFVPEKAVEMVHSSHPLLKNVHKNKPQKLLALLKEKYPNIFPNVSSAELKDAAQRFLHMGTREFVEDISSPEAYKRALNALAR